jgi:hypothetical protein
VKFDFFLPSYLPVDALVKYWLGSLVFYESFWETVGVD